MTWGTFRTPSKRSTAVRVNSVGEHYAIGPGGAVAVPMFDDSGFDWLVQYAREQIQDKYDCPYVVTGKRRHGKSMFTTRFSRVLYPEFKVQDIHFTMQSFIEALERLPPADPSRDYYPTALYDEGVTGFYNQEWYAQVPYIKILNTIGKKQLTMPILLPNLADLNPKVRSLVTFWVYLFERGLAEIRIPSVNQFDGSIFWTPLCAIRFSPLEDEFWQEYEHRKDRFIDEYTKEMGASEGVGGRLKNALDQRDKLLVHVLDRGWMTQTELGGLWGLDQSRVSKIRNSYLKRLEKEGKLRSIEMSIDAQN